MDTNLSQIVCKTSAKCSFEVRTIMLAMWHASTCECDHNYVRVAIHVYTSCLYLIDLSIKLSKLRQTRCVYKSCHEMYVHYQECISYMSEYAHSSVRA